MASDYTDFDPSPNKWAGGYYHPGPSQRYSIGHAAWNPLPNFNNIANDAGGYFNNIAASVGGYGSGTNGMMGGQSMGGGGYGGGGGGIFVPNPNYVDPRAQQAAQMQQLQKAYTDSYAQAKQANLDRYNQIIGGPAGSGAPAAGQPPQTTSMVQINGRWTAVDALTDAQKKAGLARNPQNMVNVGGKWVNPSSLPQPKPAPNAPQPLMGGYYGEYARAMQNVKSQNDAAANLQNQYAQRTATGMGYLQGYGAQQQQDTNERYNNLQNSQYQNLISRGLTGSTVASSVADQVERERNKALSQLGTDVIGTNLQAYQSLSGQQLQNQGQQNQYLGKLDYDTQTQIPNQMLNFATQRADPYPDLTNYYRIASGLGKGSASPYGY